MKKKQQLYKYKTNVRQHFNNLKFYTKNGHLLYISLIKILE